jgi:phosphatidylglycerophosphate synthase
MVALFLMLYVIADGIDGPLARAYGNNHEGGSIMDIYADQLGVVFLPAAASFHLDTNGTLAVLFSCGYIIFIVLVVYSNELHIVVKKFFRVKYPMYIFYTVCLFFNKEWMSYFFFVFCAYYWVKITFQLKTIYDFHGSTSGQK